MSTKSKQTEKEKYITRATIKERGWTDGKISLLLKEPDKEVPNPFYKSASKMKLYSLTRVIEQEKEKSFQV